MNGGVSYILNMKLEAGKAEKLGMSEGENSLYRQFFSTKPQFSSSSEARDAFIREIEAIAISYKMSIEQLVQFADESDTIPSADRKKILRLSNLIAALRK